MSEFSMRSSADIGNTVGQVHKFGAASESIFRWIYRGLHRRRALERNMRLQGRPSQAEPPSQGTFSGQRLRHRPALRTRAGELERLQAILGNPHEGVIILDRQGKVTMTNPAARIILGGKKSLRDCEQGTLFASKEDDRPDQAELSYLGDSGELSLNDRLLRAYWLAIGDGQGSRLGTMIILRDVAIDASAQRLEDGYSSQPAGNRRPTLSLVGLASGLLDGEPADAAFNRQLLNRLLEHVDALDQFLMNLSDIVRLAEGSMIIMRQPVTVESLLWSVVTEAFADVSGGGIDLLVMSRGISGLQLSGDEFRLRRALSHLVRNGAHYNRRGGFVALSVALATKRAAPFIEISVKDNGVGIKESDLPRIFERGYRRDYTDPGDGEQPRGLGYGLYIARAICQAHGGSLHVSSRPGVGSAFTMSLPLLA